MRLAGRGDYYSNSGSHQARSQMCCLNFRETDNSSVRERAKNKTKRRCYTNMFNHHICCCNMGHNYTVPMPLFPYAACMDMQTATCPQHWLQSRLISSVCDNSNRNPKRGTPCFEPGMMACLPLGENIVKHFIGVHSLFYMECLFTWSNYLVPVPTPIITVELNKSESWFYTLHKQ